MANSATPNYADQLAATHAGELENVEASRAAVQASHLLVAQTAADYEAAEETLEDVKASVQSLSEKHTPHDLSFAEAAVTCARLRCKGAENKLKADERKVISSDTSLATAVIELLDSAMPETPMYTTFLKAVPVPDASDLPALVAMQTQTAVVDRHGTLSGEVTIRQYRNSTHRILDRDKIEGALVSGGTKVRCSSVTTNDGDNLDTMTVHVEAIAPSVPVLARIDTTRVQTIGSRLVYELVVPTTGLHDAIRSDGSVSYTRKLKATSDSRNFTETIEGTRRTLTVDTSVLWEMTGSLSFSVNELVARSAAESVGRFVPGVGRVVSAEVVDEGSELWHNGDRYVILRHLKLNGPDSNPTDASKVGYELYDQAVVRMVIESFTA